MKSGTATLLGWPCRENRPTTSANARSMQRSREEQRRGAGGQRPEGSAEERRGAVEDRGGGGGGVGHLLLADSFGVLAGISFYLSLFQGDHADQGRPALLRRGEQVRSETPVQKRLFICSLPFLVLPPSLTHGRLSGRPGLYYKVDTPPAILRRRSHQCRGIRSRFRPGFPKIAKIAKIPKIPKRLIVPAGQRAGGERAWGEVEGEDPERLPWATLPSESRAVFSR